MESTKQNGLQASFQILLKSRMVNVLYVNASSLLHPKPNIDVSMLLVQKKTKKSNKKTDIWFPLYCVRDQVILDFLCGQ